VQTAPETLLEILCLQILLIKHLIVSVEIVLVEVDEAIEDYELHPLLSVVRPLRYTQSQDQIDVDAYFHGHIHPRLDH
jgi:hypothetical protein